MGVIDHIEFKITCPKCGVMENTRAVETGRVFNSSWGALRPPVQSFAIVTEHASDGMPLVREASCNACEVPATVETVSSGP